MIPYEVVDEAVAADLGVCRGTGEPSVNPAAGALICADVCELSLRWIVLSPGVCQAEDLHA